MLPYHAQRKIALPFGVVGVSLRQAGNNISPCVVRLQRNGEIVLRHPNIADSLINLANLKLPPLGDRQIARHISLGAQRLPRRLGAAFCGTI